MSSAQHFRRFGKHQLLGKNIPPMAKNCAPGLMKWWSAYERTNGQVLEHLSPYQTKVLYPFFNKPVSKVVHKITHNWEPFVAVGLFVFLSTQWESMFNANEAAEWP